MATKPKLNDNQETLIRLDVEFGQDLPDDVPAIFWTKYADGTDMFENRSIRKKARTGYFTNKASLERSIIKQQDDWAGSRKSSFTNDFYGLFESNERLDHIHQKIHHEDTQSTGPPGPPLPPHPQLQPLPPVMPPAPQRPAIAPAAQAVDASFDNGQFPKTVAFGSPAYRPSKGHAKNLKIGFNSNRLLVYHSAAGRLSDNGNAKHQYLGVLFEVDPVDRNLVSSRNDFFFFHFFCTNLLTLALPSSIL